MKGKIKRTLTIILCFSLILSLIPIVVWGEETQTWENEYSYRQVGDMFGDEPLFRIKNNGESPLTVKITTYHDAEQSELYDEETIEIQPDNEEPAEYFVAGRVVIDDIHYDETESTLTYVLHKVNWSYPYKIGDIVPEDKNLIEGIETYMDKSFRLIIKVYEDEEHTVLFGDDYDEGYSCWRAVIGNHDENEDPIFEDGEDISEPYFVRANLVLDDIMDETNAERPRLTLTFHDTEGRLRQERLEDIEKGEAEKIKVKEKAAELQAVLNAIPDKPVNIKLANPDNLKIDGYTKKEALRFMGGYRGLPGEFGLQESIMTTQNSNAGLRYQYYEDKNCKNPVKGNENNLRAGKHYYVKLSYQIEYYNSHNYVEDVSYKITRSKPIEISFEFVDVEKNSKEVKQIRNIAKSAKRKTPIIYDDLAWINVLATSGFDTAMPNPQNNIGSALKANHPKEYNALVGDTNLSIKLKFGWAGDGSFTPLLSQNLVGCYVYCVDDVIYYPDLTGGVNIHRMDRVYVPEGTVNRGKTAEKRINSYLEGSNITAKISEYDAQTLAQDLEKLFDVRISGRTKAAYLTEDGIVLYDDEHSTGKENYIGWGMGTLLKDYLTQMQEAGVLGQRGTVDYLKTRYDEKEKRDVAVIPLYKLTLTNKATKETRSFAYVIPTGDAEKMREPYADWKDYKTGIITQGMNGQIPADAYTKIRVIKGGQELKVIQAKVDKNKKIKAFDINAFTNFGDGKLEDLGGGRMKVMIPLGEFRGESVGAHYFDDAGNRHDLDFTIEDYQGKKYVCFITNHFSTYGISGTTANTPINKDNLASTSQKSNNTDVETPKTGDEAQILCWLILLVAASCGGMAVKKKRS